MCRYIHMYFDVFGNNGHIWGNIRKPPRENSAFLRVIPAVTNYILCHSFWHLIWKYIWHIFLTFYSGILSDILFWHSIVAFYSCILSGIYSGILSGIHSSIHSDMFSGILFGIRCDIVCGIYSDILSGILSGIHPVWRSILAFFWYSIWLSILAFYLASILTLPPTWALPDLNCERQISMGSAHWDLELAVEVRCPLRSGTRDWMPIEIWSSRLRSGSAHWDLELAVEVRQCALRSGSRSWGPAHWDRELAVEIRRCRRLLRGGKCWNMSICSGNI